MASLFAIDADPDIEFAIEVAIDHARDFDHFDREKLPDRLLLLDCEQ